MLWGLPALQRRFVPQRDLEELDLAPTPLVDEPPPRLDQHEPSHSGMYYT